MDKTMTTKEIAAAVGQTERSVQMWAKKTGEKISSVAEKISSAGHGVSAQYTLAEACKIIEQGMGADVAAVFRTNATNAVLQATVTTRLPAGAQMLALEKIYGTEEAKKRIDFAMGYTAMVEKPSLLQIGGKQLSKAAYAVEMKERKKQEAKKYARGLKSLFD